MEQWCATWLAGAPHRWPPGWSVELTCTTASTNADLLAAAAAGAPDRSVLGAAHQTAGRGRLDRRWEAPPGVNLLVSLLLRQVPEHPHELTQRVALAAVDALGAVAGVAAELKWPNDVVVADAKLAGVLAQAGSRDGRIGHVVVGIGINVGWAPEGAARAGDGIAPLGLLAALLDAYDHLPADVTSRARDATTTIGREVRVHLDGGVLDGIAVDIEADGRLVVVDDAGIVHRITTGDVVHLRPRPLG